MTTKSAKGKEIQRGQKAEGKKVDMHMYIFIYILEQDH